MRRGNSSGLFGRQYVEQFGEALGTDFEALAKRQPYTTERFLDIAYPRNNSTRLPTQFHPVTNLHAMITTCPLCGYLEVQNETPVEQRRKQIFDRRGQRVQCRSYPPYHQSAASGHSNSLHLVRGQAVAAVRRRE